MGETRRNFSEVGSNYFPKTEEIRSQCIMNIGGQRIHEDVADYVRFMDNRCAWFGPNDDETSFRKLKTFYLRNKWIVFTFELIFVTLGLSNDEYFGLNNGAFVFLPLTLMRLILTAIATYKAKAQHKVTMLLNEAFLNHDEPWMIEVKKSTLKPIKKILFFANNYQYFICFFYMFGPILSDVFLHHIFDYLRAPFILPGPFTCWLAVFPSWGPTFWLIRVVDLWSLTELIFLFQCMLTNFSLLTAFYLGEMKLLKIKIQQLNLSDDIIDAQYREIIPLHNTIITLNAALKNHLGLTCALLSFYTSITLTLASFTVYLNVNLTVSVAYGSGFILYFSSALVYCSLGQQLENESESIFIALYNLNWYTSTPHVRKTLNMMMRQARSPLIIDYHGRYKMNLRNFMQIMKSTYSYFTLLQSMTSKT